MLDPFSLPFFQRGIWEILLLAVASGLLGTWIVLRGLAFFAHAVGTATFPGLVLADGLAFSASLGAFGAALVVAVLVGGLRRRPGTADDSATALVLAAALALGVLLASDVFHSQANVDRLLFGSLLAIDGADLRLAAITAALVVAASTVLGPRWLASGFSARAPSARGADLLLVGLIALCAVAALSAVGALLATAILVVPAATVRLHADRIRAWQALTVALAAVEGVAGMWISYQFNVPPGAAIAVLAGAVFVLAALWRALAQRVPRGAAAGAAVVALAAIGVAGCGAGGSSSATAAPGAITVAATTTQAADLVRHVGGDRVDVHQILTPNADPHDYEPRPRDVGALADADVIVRSGLGLDDWMTPLIGDSGSKAAVVDLGSGVPVRLAGTGEESGRPDPHWWHDPRNMIAATAAVERALAKADPGAAAVFAANAAAYRARLARLDAAIRACVDRVPPGERTIVTDHDALGYFARRYGIRVAGAVIPSQSTAAQASAGDLAALERTIRREHVRAVFPETSVNRKLAERIAADTGASSDHTLYGDTLGPKGSPGSTYLGMLEANADALVRGMTGGARSCRVRA